MNYENIFKILMHLKLHPEDITFIGSLGVSFTIDEKTYEIELTSEGIIFFIEMSPTEEILCSEKEYEEVKHYLDVLHDKYCEYHINKVMNSLKL